MKHMNSKVCTCDHVMTARDKTSQLQRNHQKGFYGGNVTAFADGKCPQCGEEYQLWLRQAKNTWEVVSLACADPVQEKEQEKEQEQDPNDSPEGDPPADEFDAMEREELKAWLDGLDVEYTANWGEKRLRELCRSVVAAKEGNE